MSQSCEWALSLECSLLYWNRQTLQLLSVVSLNTDIQQLSVAVCRHYFALSTNSGEQFFAFTSIAAWLLQMCGKHVEQPQEVRISKMFYMYNAKISLDRQMSRVHIHNCENCSLEHFASM